jgi:hypothetical protein
LARSHCQSSKIGGRDSRQSRTWRKPRRIDCEVLAFHPRRDFGRREGRLLRETAFEMRICRIERRSRRRMSLGRESWKPGWQVRGSRAHAVEGLSRAATWYSLVLAIAPAFSLGAGWGRMGELREADVFVMAAAGSSRSEGNIQLYDHGACSGLAQIVYSKTRSGEE